MADDTTTQPQADPNAVLNAAVEYLMGQRQQATPAPAPAARSIISLLGEALGGGASDVAPPEREAAGTRALLNFGANLSAASGPSVMPRNFGQILAQGVSGAEQSLGSSAAVSASRLGAQQAYEEKQQELQLNRIKEAIPLLQMLQTQQVQKGLLGQTQTPSTSIAAAGNVGAPIIARDTSMTAGQQANNPGNVMVTPGKPLPAGATGAVPVTGGYVASFPDVATGVAAHSDTLSGYAASGTGTIRDAVTRWVGPGQAPKEVMDGYIADVAKAVGVDPDAKIDLSNPKVQRAFILAQQPRESGKAWLSPGDVDKGLALAAARRAGAAKASGAPAAAPTATAPPIAAPGAPVTAPPPPPAPTLATGGEAAGPGGLATRNARMTTVSPAAKGDADTIIRGMIGAGADPTTLAPPQPGAVDTAGPGAPTDVQAQTKGLVVPPGVTAPPGVETTTPTRVPDVFTPQPVTLPDYIQNRIDHPESDPAIERAFRKEVGSAVGPDAGKLMNQAVANQATAIAKVKADAITEAAAYRKDTVAQQMENWKVLRAKQDAADAATLAHTRALETQTLTNRDAQINSLRDKAMAADDTIMTGLRTDAANAGGISKRLQMLRSVEADMPESGSQFFQNHKDWINYFQEHIGLPPDQLRALSSRELFSRLLTSLATDLSEKSAVGAGTARGVEIKQNVDMLPDLATDHEGRLLSLGFVQNLADDQTRKYKEAEVYRYKNSHPDPTLDLHQSLIGFDTKYEEDHPSIIPRAPRSGPTEQWMQKNVRPGMVYERWVPQMEPLTNQPVLDPTTGRPKGQWIKRTRGDDE